MPLDSKAATAAIDATTGAEVPLTVDEIALLADPAALLAAIEAEEARRSGSGSFAAFVKQAWGYVPQVSPLEWSPHMDAIAMHFEAVARGEIQKLVVNIPPGHAKSVFTLLFTAWVWTWWPQAQFICASYGADLARRDSIRCRRVIESEWYQQTYVKGAWALSDDQNTKDYYTNTAGGDRLAMGVGGTGRRAHFVLLDDPIDAKEVHSRAVREATNAWISDTISQRFVDAREPKLICIMQRLHPEDPSAYLLSGRGVEHLMLPTEYDPERACVTHRVVKVVNGHVTYERVEFWRDGRREKGDLLFPARFPREVVDRMKAGGAGELGESGFLTQHQQQPVSSKGGILKREWWRFWRYDGRLETPVRPKGCVSHDEAPAAVLPRQFDEVYVSVDCNFKAKGDARGNKEPDPVAIHLVGTRGAERFLLYRDHGAFGFQETIVRLARTAEYARLRGWEIRAWYVEEAANGVAVVETLQGKISGVLGVPPRGGKEARAWAVQPELQARCFHLPDGADWLEAFVTECGAFPRAPHDDDVDALTQGLLAIRAEPETVADKWVRLAAQGGGSIWP